MFQATNAQVESSPIELSDKSHDDDDNDNDNDANENAKLQSKSCITRQGTLERSKDIFIDLSFENETSDHIIEAPNMRERTPEMPKEVPKRNRNKFNWITHSEWKDLDAASDFIDNEGFVYYDESNLTKGQKFYFRCKRTPKTMKPYCALRYCLLLPSTSNDIILLSNGNDHY